ncbi:MAG TPA: hypothetical protein VGG75_13665 [Trebonia sp.]|jgi:hypothetical protein
MAWTDPFSMPRNDTFKVDDDGESVRILLNGAPVFTCTNAVWRGLITYEAHRLRIIQRRTDMTPNAALNLLEQHVTGEERSTDEDVSEAFATLWLLVTTGKKNDA